MFGINKVSKNGDQRNGILILCQKKKIKQMTSVFQRYQNTKYFFWEYYLATEGIPLQISR